MPLVPYQSQTITVEVCDRVYGSTIIKQKAEFLGMNISQSPQDQTVNVTVWLRVNLFAAAADGSYGDPITGTGLSGNSLSSNGLSSYDVTLVANNDCAVNALTGEVLAIRGMVSQSDWMAELELREENMMLQGDFFEMLMHTQPVEIEPMLRGFMLQANTEQFNKFK